MDTDYADDITLLAKTPAQAESLQQGSIGLHVDADKTENMSSNQKSNKGYLHSYHLLSETRGQINLHREQHLINGQRTSSAINRPFRYNKIQILHRVSS